MAAVTAGHRLGDHGAFRGFDVRNSDRALESVQSLVLLAAGANAMQAAFAEGFSTSGAFVAAFKTAIGATPGRYSSAGREAQDYARSSNRHE